MASGTWQINADLDDIRRQSGSSPFNTTQGFSGGQYSGAAYKFMTSAGRFTNITIPQGTPIVSAFLKVNAEANRTENTVRTKIDGEDVDTATQITSAGNFDGRARTAAKVNWDGIGNWAAGNWYTSPDIKTVIQEIIDRGGWSSGNAINIFWGDFEDQRSDVNARRDGTSHDSNPGNAAKLEITWGVPASQDLVCGFNVDDTHSVTGITKDNAGNRLGNCEIALFRVEAGTPPTYSFIASGMSDALGDYTFTGLTKRRFFVRAQKDGAPNLFDTTDNELEPV